MFIRIKSNLMTGKQWKIFVVKQGFLFKFDIKQGYHHIEIDKIHQKKFRIFLGTKWQCKIFRFYSSSFRSQFIGFLITHKKTMQIQEKKKKATTTTTTTKHTARQPTFQYIAKRKINYKYSQRYLCEYSERQQKY